MSEEQDQEPTSVTCLLSPSTFAAWQNCPWSLKLSTYQASAIDLQCLLNQINAAEFTVDGYFSLLTKTAVDAWQTNMGLVVGGILGPTSWKALCSASFNNLMYNIVPPVLFCLLGVSHWPSSNYTTLITMTTFNSGKATYRDLVKSNAAFFNGHLGLLTAHMVGKSSVCAPKKGIDKKKRCFLNSCHPLNVW